MDLRDNITYELARTLAELPDTPRGLVQLYREGWTSPDVDTAILARLAELSAGDELVCALLDDRAARREHGAASIRATAALTVVDQWLRRRGWS